MGSATWRLGLSLMLDVLAPVITGAQVAGKGASDRFDDLSSEVGRLVFGESLLEEFALASLGNRAPSARGALDCKTSLLHFFLVVIRRVLRRITISASEGKLTMLFRRSVVDISISTGRQEQRYL